MNDDDAHTGQAFSAGSTNIILAQHFQHGGTGHTHDHRQRDGAQHHCRQDHVRNRINEVALFAPDRRINQHKAG